MLELRALCTQAGRQPGAEAGASHSLELLFILFNKPFSSQQSAATQPMQQNRGAAAQLPTSPPACSMLMLDSLRPCRLMGAAWKLARSMTLDSRPPARSLHGCGLASHIRRSMYSIVNQ